MEIVLEILFGLVMFFFVIPSLLFFVILFGRMPEKTAEGSGLQGTYYAPYAEKMIAAEKRLNNDPNLKRVGMTSHDGLSLCADMLDHGNNKLAILVHGYMTAPSKNFAVSLENFIKSGFDVLLVHQRAHGPSSGKHCTLGLREQYDVLDWIEWSRALNRYASIVLYGVSMGSASIAFAADKIDKSLVKVMIHDSEYDSLNTQLRNLAHRWHIPSFMILPPLKLLAKLFLKIDLNDSVRDSLKNTSIPSVFLYGLDDGTIMEYQCKGNYESCAAEKIYIPVKGAEHTLAMIVGGEDVWNQVHGFMKQYI